LYGQIASPTGSGVYGTNQASSGAAVGVLGQSSSGAGYGVEGSALSATGVYGTGVTGVLAAGTSLGVSATATSFSANAFYGRVNSSGAAAVFTNDNLGGTPLQINNMRFPATDSGFTGDVLTTNGSGLLSFAPAVPSPLALGGGSAIAVITGANSGTGPGVLGQAGTGSSMGMEALQTSSGATLSSGGVALMVSGPVRVDSWTSSVENDASSSLATYTLSSPRSSGSIVFSAGKTAITSYTVTDTNFVGTNSIVLVSFSGISSVTSTYSVINQTTNSFEISFGATSASMASGSMMNFLIIRQ
jgi:hypothetical protein